MINLPNLPDFSLLSTLAETAEAKEKKEVDRRDLKTQILFEKFQEVVTMSSTNPKKIKLLKDYYWKFCSLQQYEVARDIIKKVEDKKIRDELTADFVERMVRIENYQLANSLVQGKVRDNFYKNISENYLEKHDLLSALRVAKMIQAQLVRKPVLIRIAEAFRGINDQVNAQLAESL